MADWAVVLRSDDDVPLCGVEVGGLEAVRGETNPADTAIDGFPFRRPKTGS